MWLVALVVLPVASLAVAPLGTLVGLRGPYYAFDPVWSAVLAVNLGVPAGVVLTLAVLAVRALRRATWIRVVLGVYAVAATAVAVDFSGMCG